ncbi:MAG: M20/M25/M40 family metallo-hydrolase, partial [Microbacterium sp.]
RAVHRLGPGTFHPRAPRTVSRMLTLLARRSTGAHRLLYRTLAALPPVSARVLAAMGGETAALVRTTVAATMQSGGTAANVLPSQASATLSIRLAPGESADRALARVRRRIRDRLVGITVLEDDDPSPESPVDNPQFAHIARAVTAAYPGTATVPYIMVQATDSRHYHRFCPAVYRFAPLTMDAAQRASIHGVDEQVTVDALERGERFHRALIEGLA